MVGTTDPVADSTGGVLDAADALVTNALLVQRPDHPLDHTDLLRAVWRDELLLQAIVADQRGVAPTGEVNRIGFAGG